LRDVNGIVETMYMPDFAKRCPSGMNEALRQQIATALKQLPGLNQKLEQAAKPA
jgi:hypothetical protein